MTNNIQDTLKERGSRYGTMEENARITQSLMDVLMSGVSWGKCEQIHKECLHNVCAKMSRIVSGDPDYVDNPHDMAGYSTLLEKYLVKKEDVAKSVTIHAKEVGEFVPAYAKIDVYNKVNNLRD